MRKRSSLISLILILIICTIMIIGTISKLDFVMDIAFVLFIPFALISGKQSKTPAAAYGYLSLSFMIVLLLMLKKLS